MKFLSRVHKTLWGLASGPRSLPRDEFSGKIFCVQEHSLVYFAIPKVANTTLQRLVFDLLRPSLPSDIVAQYDRTREAQPIFSNQEIKQHFLSHGLLLHKSQAVALTGVLKFAVVRDPFERLYSCWRDKIRSSEITEGAIVGGVHSGFAIYGGAFRPSMSFEDFVDAVAEIPREQANPHFRPQTDFIFSASGIRLVDEIIKFEEINTALPALVRRHLGIEIALSHENRSPAVSHPKVRTGSFLRHKVYKIFYDDHVGLGYDGGR